MLPPNVLPQPIFIFTSVTLEWQFRSRRIHVDIRGHKCRVLLHLQECCLPPGIPSECGWAGFFLGLAFDGQGLTLVSREKEKAELIEREKLKAKP